MTLLHATKVSAQYENAGSNYSKYNRPKYNYSGNSPSQDIHYSGNQPGNLSAPYDPIDPPASGNPADNGGPTNPDCDPLDPTCPIDSGVYFLLIGGLGYGLMQLRAKRKLQPGE